MSRGKNLRANSRQNRKNVHGWSGYFERQSHIAVLVVVGVCFLGNKIMFVQIFQEIQGFMRRFVFDKMLYQGGHLQQLVARSGRQQISC